MEAYHMLPLQTNAGIVLSVDLDRILPHLFQFIIQHLSHHLMLHGVGNTAHIHIVQRINPLVADLNLYLT
jgi:hypothetical protein